MRKALPVVVLVGSFIATQIVVNARPEPPRKPRDETIPAVECRTIGHEDYRVSVTTHGSVTAWTQSNLVAQVGGTVQQINPALKAGGCFAAGEVLLRIDARDYELAVVRTKAEVARLEAQLARERAEADVARQEWAQLGKGTPSGLAAREPQLRAAEAQLEGARAALEQAQLNLSRCVVRAPYDGRVRRAHVDIGGFVAPGAPIATIYAVDAAEVALPVTADELVRLDLWDRLAAGDAPAVTLRATLDGRQHEWAAHVTRTEGEVDATSRMIQVVARIDAPFACQKPQQPLALGMFVEAKIHGPLLRNVLRLPRAAVNSDGRITIVDRQSKLAFVDVAVAAHDGEDVLVRGDLPDGGRVCLTRLIDAEEGLRVQPMEADTH
jgi:RND family efflux transporter MFP subunit